MPVDSGIHRPEGRSKRDIPSWLAIHRPGVRSKRSVPSRSVIRRLRDRGKWAVPSSLGVHSPEDHGRHGIPNNLDIHNPDIRKQEVRRLGSRNRCPVGVEVCLRPRQISRSPLRSLLRGRLPAHRPPRLQWQRQKPLPIPLHQDRVARDHRGLCRPRGPTLTRQSHRAQFGSLSRPCCTDRSFGGEEWTV